MALHLKILGLKAVRELRSKGYGLFDGEHSLILETAGNKTSFIQAEAFTGILAGTITQSVLRDTVASMHAMNDALKKRAELAPGRPQN